jgi:hypothetical protein
MKNKYDHKVHKYELVQIGEKGYTVYKCMLSNCRHFIQKELAASRLSLCWGNCGNAVMITKGMIAEGRVRPLCDECKEKRKERRELAAQLEVRNDNPV